MDAEARIELAETLVSLNRLSEAIRQYEELRLLRTPTLNVCKRYTVLMMTATLREDAGERNWDAIAIADRFDQGRLSGRPVGTERAG